MKKAAQKTLSIAIETIRVLRDEDALRRAAGGSAPGDPLCTLYCLPTQGVCPRPPVKKGGALQ
jgi:hypothetical protein